MEKFFKLKENNTTVSREVVGGITTFFAMAYIIFVNPTYLSATGMDYTAVMVATCLSAAIGTILTAFMANVPFAQAPGMGLNAFFTYSICLGMGYTWQQGLTIVLISGILFLFITISPLRGMIISAIPSALKSAISAGIGLFVAFIGLLNADVIKLKGDVIVDGALVASDFSVLGNIMHGAPLLAIIGLLVTGILIAFNVKGAIFIGIIISTILAFPMGLTTLPESYTISQIGNISQTFFQFDFGGILSLGIFPLITAVASFLIVDMFDSVGTLIGTAENAGMLDEDGNFPRGDKALVADAVATCAGACLGTSTVTTFVESSTGISEGARTGLASLVTGLLFLASILLAPIAGIVPSAATAPALIIVGVLMMRGALNIDWNDFEVAMPCFLTIAMMPFAYSISDGIGFGFISWVVIKLSRGKGKQVPALMYILAAMFIAKYVLTFA